MKQNYSLGPTFNGIASTFGAIMLLGGILLLVFDDCYSIRYITFALFGMILFVSIKGTLIDMDKKRIKPYIHFFLFKVGFWTPLNEFSKITLTYFNESQNYYIKILETTVTSRTYDIALVEKDGGKYIIQEFSNYEDAKELLKELGQNLNLGIDDQFERLRESIEERKQYTRR